MLRVIKVGGSLLTWPGLQATLPRWLNTLSPSTNLLIFGGGECVEAMRQLDALWHLDPTAMHWRCVRLLDATFEIAQELWPQWEIFPADSRPPLDGDHSDAVERLQHFLTDFDPNSPRNIVVHIASIYTRCINALPYTWDTTTDSIAAYLAQRLKATELFLLKSTTPPGDLSASQAAESGLVDAAFPTIAPRDCRILTVDLTSQDWQANRIRTSN